MLGIHILYLCFIASLFHNNYWRLNNRDNEIMSYRTKSKFEYSEKNALTHFY